MSALTLVAMLWGMTPTGAAVAAEPCTPPVPDLAVRLDAAWGAFDLAELRETDGELNAALRELPCQARVITTEELEQLFLLDATASLATNDEDGAVYAVIRRVLIAADAPVDPRYGPAVADLVATWSRRLATTLTIDNQGKNVLYVDGRGVAAGSSLATVEGEHVLQWISPTGVHTEVRELVGRALVDTGRDNPIEVPPVAATEGPTDAVALVEPAPIATLPTAPPSPSPALPKRRRTTPALWGTGLALAAVGGGAVIAGWQIQERFEANPYDGDSYGGCARTDPCYAGARADRIRSDATLIRALYGSGYGLVGVGTVLFGVGLGVSPHGAQVAVTVPW